MRNILELSIIVCVCLYYSQKSISLSGNFLHIPLNMFTDEFDFFPISRTRKNAIRLLNLQLKIKQTTVFNLQNKTIFLELLS